MIPSHLPKRYEVDLGSDGFVKPHERGEFVFYDDYSYLEHKLDKQTQEAETKLHLLMEETTKAQNLASELLDENERLKAKIAEFIHGENGEE